MQFAFLSVALSENEFASLTYSIIRNGTQKE